jgi:serine/threonine-protein kinase
LLELPLHRDFRYIHEPLPMDDPALPVLGHEELLGALKRRLTYSHGGAFLITGFRGVGKSTLVMRALSQAAAERPPNDVLLTVYLNVARHMEPDQLLFAVVRRVFETLHAENLLERLPTDVQQALLLAYTRTSLSFKQTHSEGSEGGGTVGFGVQRGPLASLAPTLSMTGKRTSARAVEASFLAYSETDVEHDLVRIIQLLDTGRMPRQRRRLLRRRHGTRRGTPVRIHPVVVLDEVDKLTDSSEEALGRFEQLLGRLKSVLTARNAHFLLVGGPDLHDRALRDADRGNGLYESVFAWRMHVPCLWNSPDRLLRGLFERSQAEGARDGVWDAATPRLDPLTAYLRYKSRGVLRRLLQELNALVDWDSTGTPWLRVGETDYRQRIEFYGDLDGVVAHALTPLTADASAALPIDEDRWRLGAYHVVDWALRSRGRVFAATDITDDGQLDPLLHVDARLVDRMLRHLVDAEVLTVVSEEARRNATLYGNLADAEVRYYRLTDEYVARLPELVRHSESDRADLGMPDPPERDATTVIRYHSTTSTAIPEAVRVTRRAAPIARLGDRYEVRDLIGQGGMGAVYSGRDLRTGEAIAVKMLHRGLADNEEVLARFRREAEIGMRIRHRNVVRTLALVDEPEHALIMELVTGSSLQDELAELEPLPAQVAVRIAQDLGEALRYLHAQHLSRIDLKPANIILHPSRGAVVIDLGLARGLHNDASTITATGALIGTPAYMSPEQVRGEEADIRSDLFSLGLLLYQCLAGRSPYTEGPDIYRILISIAENDVDVDALPVSGALRQVVRRCTARDRADRYQDPAEFLEALRATPEAGEAGGAGETGAGFSGHP